MKILKVKPVEDRMVLQVEKMPRMKRYVGYKKVITDGGEEFQCQKNKVVDVEDNAYYRKSVKVGDLVPADEETAKKCGVSFVKEEQITTNPFTTTKSKKNRKEQD